MKRVVMVLMLCIAVLSGGCGEFVIGLGLLIECGPMPMSPDACRGGRGWWFGDGPIAPVERSQESEAP